MKVILIIIDGLNYQTTERAMGYLLAECKAKKGHLRQIQSEIPPLSRPLYETILTGKTPIESGITHNQVIRLSTEESIFHHTKSLGKIGAAAASHWISELYNHAPFEPIEWRFVANPSFTIPYGIFYFHRHYPDSHIFSDGEYLREHYQPDFLLIHPSGIHNSGTQYGADSSEYHKSVRLLDETLAQYMPTWLQRGYQVLITADYGIHAGYCDREKLIEGTSIPLFIFGTEHHQFQSQTIQQTDICPIICQLLEEQ